MSDRIVSAATPIESTISDAHLQNALQVIAHIEHVFASRIVGQVNLKKSLIVCLLSGGHILLESMPGLAKTTAVSTIAASINGSFKRIQCTPDLLPSDIVGSQIYSRTSGEFETQLGPVHANFVLLDEINRANAKTQSAMLEAMAERQTTIGGNTHKLPNPSVILATQNPVEQEGTYVLPEAQLDRFLLKEIIDYPTPQEELEILHRVTQGIFDQAIPAAQVTTNHIVAIQKLSKQVYIDPAIQKYIVNIVAATRNTNTLGEDITRYIGFGASPRATIAFQAVSQAIALMEGRKYVIPEDVRRLRHGILRHRLILTFDAVVDKVSPDQIIDSIFDTIPTP